MDNLLFLFIKVTLDDIVWIKDLGGDKMKIFISADIEGITGCTSWDETEKAHPDYNYFANQMTLEVKAACEGANEAGATEILINDAHDSGRNIDHNLLPENTKLVRGWAGDIYSMVQELNHTFDALLFIGYHSAGGKDANPLAHTMNNSILDFIKINDEIASEFVIHAYIAAYLGVPVAFLSGDLGLCDEVKRTNNNIAIVAVKEGKGNSTVNIHPTLAISLIKDGVKDILSKDLSKNKIQLPSTFKLEVRYKEHRDAIRRSFYPGVTKIDENTIQFKSNDYIEILKAIHYLT